MTGNPTMIAALPVEGSHHRFTMGRRMRSGVAALTMAIAAAFAVFAESPADAAAPCTPVSCVYNYHDTYVAASCVTGSGCTSGAVAIGDNGSQVTMYCWFDSSWANGNYNSNRWFQITLPGLSGRWIVHSSYVYHQTVVGRCP